MSISVTCDSCETEYQLRDAAAGKKIRCKSCDAVIEVPFPAEETYDALDEFEEVDDRNDRDLDDLDEVDEESPRDRMLTSSAKKRGQKSKRSGRRSSNADGGYLARQWAERPARTIFLGIYCLALLLGFVVPFFWIGQATTVFLLGVLMILGGIVLMILLEIWHNPGLLAYILTNLFLPLSYHGQNKNQSQEHTRLPSNVIWSGLFMLLLSLPPFFLAVMFTALPKAGNLPVAAQPNQNMAMPVVPGGPAAPGPTPPVNTVGGPRDLFDISKVPVPQFIVDPQPRTTPVSNVTYFEARAQSANGSRHPGSDMRLRFYLPSGKPAPRSLGCVLVGPAGSNMISGKPLDGPESEDEFIPYVQAGMVVVHFSLDGPIDDLETASNFAMSTAYKDFSASGAGIVNARNAMTFARNQIPEVDGRRIYIAGHSSAGSLALLFAEHEPTLRGCMAFAPACDPSPELRQLEQDPRAAGLFPGISAFVERSAPASHVGMLNCPVFLFHGQADTVVAFSQSVNFAKSAGMAAKTITFSPVPDAHHYTAMAEKGVPLAVQWLKTQFGEPGNGSSAPQVQTNPAVPLNTPPMTQPNIAPLPQPARPSSGIARPPNPGERVVTLKYAAFTGTGDARIAAHAALVGKPGVDASVLHIDPGHGRIVVLLQGNSISTNILSESLKAAGFTMSPGTSVGAWKP